jgi:hypothetical protein
VCNEWILIAGFDATGGIRQLSRRIAVTTQLFPGACAERRFGLRLVGFAAVALRA